MPMPAVLLVHDDPDVLDWLTTVLEAAGYEVGIGASALSARAWLERNRATAILAGWDAGGGAGRALAGWARAGQPELIERMAALTEDPAAEAEARALGVTSLAADAYDEVLEFAAGAARAAGAGPAVGFEPGSVETERPPRLLLVEDDVHQIRFIREILAGYGFDVTVVEDAREAIATIEGASERFDVVLSDWYMAGGGGEALYAWLIDNDIDLLERCVFMTGGPTRPIREQAPTATCYPKGQDSKLLIAALTRAARRAKGR